MKKLLTLTALGAILTTPTIAVQKCVALDASNTTCTSNYEEYDSNPDWGATCTTNGVSVSIKGAVTCSKTAGSAVGEVYSGYLPTGGSNKDKLHCWCKIISPAISSWVYLTDYDSTNLCIGDCARYCAYKIQSEAALRQGLFSSLSN